MLVHRKTVLLGRFAPCADCDFRAVVRFAHDDLARLWRGTRPRPRTPEAGCGTECIPVGCLTERTLVSEPT